MKGGGSFYQAQQYVNPSAGQGAFKLGGGGCGCAGRLLKGGRKGQRRQANGGFLPSLMGGLISNGPLLVAPAVAQASRLLRNESERQAARRRTSRRRKTRRTNRKAKNTRKA